MRWVWSFFFRRSSRGFFLKLGLELVLITCCRRIELCLLLIIGALYIGSLQSTQKVTESEYN
ncbi:hypothetical protein RchiOBHm_Chr5g0083191 [Rosa chinensis]|uniref:Uncharacterized protein n=1 Tax=Rosa chinensis TaxID=74649 RepID=A0A2P6QNI5_ROSCH|nr:hypothetical protein RchiOBHm_Chr5g0083191 [Rosa chinensis]